MDIPEMQELWSNLEKKIKEQTANKMNRKFLILNNNIQENTLQTETYAIYYNQDCLNNVINTILYSSFQRNFMSYAKHFYVERALQEFNFPTTGEGTEIEQIASLVIPFAAFAAKKNDLSLSATVEEALAGKDLPVAVKEFMAGEGAKWAKCSLETFEKVSSEDIKNYITDKIIERNEKLGYAHGAVLSQPDTLNILSALLLDIKAGDSVVDLGTGFASFLIYVANNYSCKKLEGIEINANTRLYASLLAYLSGFEMIITLDDVLKLSDAEKYDKIHSFPEINSNLVISFIEKILKIIIIMNIQVFPVIQSRSFQILIVCPESKRSYKMKR